MTIICAACGHGEPHLGAMYGHWAAKHGLVWMKGASKPLTAFGWQEKGEIHDH